MDLRDLMAKLDKIGSKKNLMEAVTMADVQAAVGKEQDEQKRAAALNDIAWKENLPGLYDPVSGYFVPRQSQPTDGQRYSISATAREADTQALAKMGLVPSSAKTSALGGLVGTGKFSNTSDQNAAAEKDVKQQSAKVYGAQASDKFKAEKLKQLNDLVAKISMAEGRIRSELSTRLAESFGYKLDEKVTLGTGPVVQKPVGDSGAMISVGKFQSEIPQIKALMAELADMGDDPEVAKALAAAQSAIEKVEGGSKTTGGATQPGTNTSNDITSPETQKKIARFKELLMKAGGKGGAAATPTASASPARDNFAQANAYIDQQSAAADKKMADTRAARIDAARQKTAGANATVDKELAGMDAETQRINALAKR
jgi:hypothetical protein